MMLITAYVQDQKITMRWGRLVKRIVRIGTIKAKIVIFYE